MSKIEERVAERGRLIFGEKRGFYNLTVAFGVKKKILFRDYLMPSLAEEDPLLQLTCI